VDERIFDWSQRTFNWPLGEYLTLIPTLRAARRALGPASDRVRSARSRVYFDEASMRSRGKLRLGMHDRGEEFIFADGSIHEGDLSGHKRHLPLHVKVIRRREMRIRGGETFDATSSHHLWPGLHFREELYVYMHIDRLIVEPGAALYVRGNVFVLACDMLVLKTVGEDEAAFADPVFDIRILGTDHPAFGQARPLPARDGAPGFDGEHGANRTPPSVRPSIFGPVGDTSVKPAPGGCGGDGGDGGDGTHGQNGGMAMLADIRLKSMRGFSPRQQVRIFSQAGQGRPGGAGGAGGAGGDGGSAPEWPGAGGAGGRGGDGGHGGHGGLSGHIFLTIPVGAGGTIEPCSMDSLGGPAGRGGAGGAPGRGGAKTDPRAPGSPCATDGRPGAPGRDGRAGRPRKGARIYISADDEQAEPCLHRTLERGRERNHEP
jgi:hypothetical protein